MRIAIISAHTIIACIYAHAIIFAIPLSQRNPTATVHIKHTGETRRFVEYTDGASCVHIQSGPYYYAVCS
jgi:hypothetical protein